MNEQIATTTPAEPWRAITADLVRAKADARGYRLGRIEIFTDHAQRRCCAVGALALDLPGKDHAWERVAAAYDAPRSAVTALSQGFEGCAMRDQNGGHLDYSDAERYLHAVGSEVAARLGLSTSRIDDPEAPH